eukprot:scaffold126340_cov78-Phaeocystis_antarctica.AAC.1
MSVGRTAKCTGPPQCPKMWSLNASSSPEERNDVKRRSSEDVGHGAVTLYRGDSVQYMPCLVVHGPVCCVRWMPPAHQTLPVPP